MNNTNISSDTITSESINMISNFIGFYGISSISLIGILLNTFIHYLLGNKNLKYGFYQHIRLKTSIDILMCILGFGSLSSYVCIRCKTSNTYEIILYQCFSFISSRIIYLISALHGIYLISNRYLIIKNRNHWIVNIRLIYYIPILIILPCLLIFPVTLVISINKSAENSELFDWTWSSDFETLYFRVYMLFLIIIGNLLPLVILLIMNFLCLNEYKKRLKIKTKITIQSIENLKNLENDYTRATIILTVFFVITRLSEILNGLFAVYSLNSNFDIIKISVFNLTKQFSYLFVFGLSSFDGLLYLQIDKNLRKLAKEKIKKIKVFLNYIHF